MFRASQPGAPAAKGEIERPGQGTNLVWQTRADPPTEYENRLGDALERLFGDGAQTLGEVVAGLNALGLPAPDGRAWDEQTFQAEIKRLGA